MNKIEKKYPALKNEENVEFLADNFIYLKKNGEIVIAETILDEFMKLDEKDYLPFWDIPSLVSRKAEIIDLVKNGPFHQTYKDCIETQKRDLERRKFYGGFPPWEDLLLSKEGKKNRVDELLGRITHLVSITEAEEEAQTIISELKELVSKEKHPIKFLEGILSMFGEQ